MALQLLAAPSDPALLDLPWGTPLEDWPADQLVALPRGLSRHVVRFVRLGEAVYAVKEIAENAALREYGLLRQLERRGPAGGRGGRRRVRPGRRRAVSRSTRP